MALSAQQKYMLTMLATPHIPNDKVVNNHALKEWKVLVDKKLVSMAFDAKGNEILFTAELTDKGKQRLKSIDAEEQMTSDDMRQEGAKNYYRADALAHALTIVQGQLADYLEEHPEQADTVPPEADDELRSLYNNVFALRIHLGNCPSNELELLITRLTDMVVDLKRELSQAQCHALAAAPHPVAA
jgi:hypothetical protein